MVSKREQPPGKLVSAIQRVDFERLSRADRVEMHFEPAPVDGNFTAQPHPDQDQLLVRGSWPVVEGGVPHALLGRSRT